VLGGTQNRGDEPSLAVEHNDRLEAVLIVVGVEQRQLLATMDGVERVVEIEVMRLGAVAKEAQ
jgi:hypothetical protein